MDSINLTTIPDARPIPSFPGYWATPDGKIWSNRFGGPPYVLPTGMVYELQQSRDRRGYGLVYPCKNRRPQRQLVHRLILEAFIGPCPLNFQGRHLDGKPSNNSISNLAWGTKQENEDDKRRHGTLKFGTFHWAATITDDDVRAIRSAAAQGIRQRVLARMFRLSCPTICNIVKRKSWKHID